MIKSILLIGLQAAFLCLHSASAADSSKPLFIAANHIAFSVACERRSYKIGDAVTIHWSVRNVSRARFFVARDTWTAKCGSPPHLWAGLKKASGRTFFPGYGGDCMGPNLTPISQQLKKDLVLLRPGQAHRGTFTLDTSLFRAQLTPGRYEVAVSFSGWQDKQFDEAEKADIETLGHPLLTGDRHATCGVQLIP